MGADDCDKVESSGDGGAPATRGTEDFDHIACEGTSELKDDSDATEVAASNVASEGECSTIES